MNHTYRLVWNDVGQCQVLAPETARSRGKRTGVKPLAAAMLAAFACNAHALPTDGVVSAGSGSIAQSGATMTVNQSSQNLAINWQSFGIAANESVNFNQPNVSAIALNRVLGSDPSQILGQLNANGQVWVLNPNGLLFGASAQVSVGGLVASTLNISDADFLAGNRTFSGSGGAVVNQGSITAANGGYVALLGGQVSNEGTIIAQLGTVALAAGDKVTLDFNGDKLLNVQVDQGALDALAQNNQLIRADGGTVLMTAQAADALATAVVNNTGVIEARTLENHNGVIKLLGDMQVGTVNVGGTLDASATLPPLQGEGWGGDGVNGGFIETSSAHVHVADGAVVTTRSATGQSGTWLIDPNDYTIAAIGGDISGATLSANLGGGNIEIQSSSGASAGNGDIHVNDAVSWSANTLTLTAARDVNINAVMTASNTAALALNPATANGADGAVAGGTVNVGLTDAGFTGRVDFFQADGVTPRSGTGFLTINGNGYTVITDLGAPGSVTTTDLQGMSGNLAGYYALGANIDASATSGWNSGQGFAPVGSGVAKFTGVFDGLGHTVSGLTINRTTGGYLGMFASVSGALRNVGVVGGSVAVGSAAGTTFVGGLVGVLSSGSVSHSYASADVSGVTNVGGLVGWNNGGTVSGSHAAGNVSGADKVGGLVGLNQLGTVSDSHVSGGSVTASGASLGGLVGLQNGTLDNSHYDIDSVTLNGATGEVTPGGLYGGQYQDWLNNGKTLAVADYFSLDGGGYYTVGSVQALKDMLGFADQAAYKFRLTADLALPAGYMIPEFAAVEFDGGGHALSGLQLGLNNFYRGFIGQLSGGSVHDLGLTGVAVDGYTYVGALVGYNNGGTVGNSYATGAVFGGGSYVGGLVGYNFTGGSVSNSYATIAVNGNGGVGGLVGRNQGTVSNSYASGAVSGSSSVGGLVGFNSGTVTASFWDTQTSGQATSSGGTGKTTAQMMQLATFSGWNIDGAGSTGAVWRIYDGYTTPLLRGFLTPLTITPDYDGSGAALTNIAAYTISGAYDPGQVLGATSTLTLASTAADAYTAALGAGLYSTQDGYDLTGGSRMISTPGSAGGDIVLANPISWTSGTLVINAAGNVQTTAAISGSGSAIFDLQAGTWNQVNATLPGFDVYDFRISGGTFVRALSGDGSVATPYQLADIYGVQGMGSSGMLGLNYELASDADASGTANWNGGLGFTPVGASASKFTGVFDGLGHTITGLTINNVWGDFQGLFGWSTGTLRNIGLLNSSVSGRNGVGTLAGLSSGTISYSYADGGSVTGNNGGNSAGGLMGGGSGTIDYSYANVSVTGANTGAGGLKGTGTGNVSNSYATGSVTGFINVGGLVGQQGGGTISNSYSTGAVTGTFYVGGLTGGASGAAPVNANVINSYWDTQTSGQATSLGGTGKTTAEMKQLATFAAWDIDAAGGTGKVWRIYEGSTTPLLRNYLTPLTVTANNATTTYSGAAYSGGNGVSYSTAPNANLLGTASYGGTSQGAVNAGSYTITASGYWSNQRGYDISYVDGALTVNQVALTVTANDASKGYDGLAWNGGNGVGYTGFVNGETSAVLGGALAYGGDSQGATNAGSYVITASGLTSGNYTIGYANGALTVNQAALTVAANAASKTYDGLAYTGGNGVGYSGFVNGETSAVLGGALAYGGSSQGATNAGSYLITPSGLTGGNYAISYANGALTVNKADATIAANSGSVTYNGLAQSVGGFTAAGLVNGENASVLTGVTAGGSGTNAGTYATTASGSDGNYNLSFVDGSLTIAKADATVTANSGSVTYNGLTQSVSGFSASGLVNGENASVLTSVTAGGSGTNAGTYATTASGTDGNYNLSFVDGALTVNQAALSVTASGANKTYDGLAYTGGNGVGYSGFVNGETSAVLGGTLAYGGSSQGATNAGSYLITPSGLTSGNYAISYADGALTVTPAALTVAANAASKTYDGLAYTGGNGVGYSGFVNGETSAVLGGALAYGGSSQGATNAGGYLITPGGLTSGNYAISYANGALTIAKAHLTATADNQSRLYGQANPTFGQTIAGFVNGEDATSANVTGGATGSSAATATSGVGNYAIAGSIGTLSAANYDFTAADGTLTINPPPTVTTVDLAALQAAIQGVQPSKDWDVIMLADASAGRFALTVSDGGVKVPIATKSSPGVSLPAEAPCLPGSQCDKDRIDAEQRRQAAERITKEKAAQLKEGMALQFGSGSSDPVNLAELDKLADAVNVGRVMAIEVTGYADEVGSMEYNLKLSLDRAARVKAMLVERGVDPKLIRLVGKGKTEPLADNNTREGRAQNRRVVTKGLEFGDGE